MIELLLTVLAVILVLALIYYVLGLIGLDERYKVGVILVVLLLIVLYLLRGGLPI